VLGTRIFTKKDILQSWTT